MTGRSGASSLRVGSVFCETLKDEHFVVLRRAFNLQDTFLESNFHFSQLGNGGGKGGDLIARTVDGRFFVKQLNVGDAKTLLQDNFLSSYVARVKEGATLICKIVAAFTHDSLGRFIVVANCLPANIKTWNGLYDLKGSADDKVLIDDGVPVIEAHKRCWKLSWMASEALGCDRCIPVTRRRYLSGKRKAYDMPIYLTKEQKREVMELLREDVAFLTNHGLMDYSLIMAVHGPPLGTYQLTASDSANILHSKSYVSYHRGSVSVVYFGIIDFLQAWTVSKLCAHHIKACCAPTPISTIPPRLYGRQFLNHFEWKFRALAYPVPLRDCNALINLSHEIQEDEELRAQLEALSRTTSELRDKLDIAEKRIDELVYAGK